MANNIDLESPGYEFRRSYHCMNVLYNKLIALNYAKEFCLEYKCRPIHKYYFSYQSQNANEQYFTFACLCAWLIKKKCNFNIKLDPQDYEDPEITIQAIVEALRLILADVAANPSNSINFAPFRLRSGHGPEVVWTLNVIADAALQVATGHLSQLRSPPSSASKLTKIAIIYEGGGQDGLNQKDALTISSQDGAVVNRNQLDKRKGSSDSRLANDDDEKYDLEVDGNFDESSLLFEEDNVTLVDEYYLNNNSDEIRQNFDDNGARIKEDSHKMAFSAPLLTRSDTSPEEWYLEVERVSHQLQANMDMDAKSLDMADWKTHSNQLKSIEQMLDKFIKNSKPFVDNSIFRIENQLQIIFSREKFLQTNLQNSLKELVQTKILHEDKVRMQSELNSTLSNRTASLEELSKKLMSIRNQIEERVNYLNDPTPITTIRKSIDQLKVEIAEFDIRIGLALHALFKKKLSMKY